MKTVKKLHPVVAEFIQTDEELGSILARFRANEHSPITDAMYLLHEMISGRQSANGALHAAKNIDAHGYDTDLCILFLGSWAHASFAQSSFLKEKLSEAWTLIHRAKALFSAQTQPDCISFIKLIEAHLIGSSGDHSAQENAIIESRDILPADSPRRKFVVMELASLLARIGRLKDVDAEFNKVYNETCPNLQKNWLDAILFINLIETGQIMRAHALAKQISSLTRDSIYLKHLEKYRILLDLISTSPHNIQTDPVPPDNPNDLPDWALVIQCLLTNRVHQALRWARVCEKKNETFTSGHEFMSFNLLRAELAEHNTEAARRIMDIRHECGNKQYIDSFFLARISLLAGDKDTACQHFASLLKSIDHYNAEGRLAFELRLASELPRDVLLELVRTSEKIRSKRNSPRRINSTKTAQSPYPIDPRGLDRIISSTPVMDTLKRTIHQFATVTVPVIITGETGTGKELVAKALHETGPSATRPFVAINCGAISESLLESELFGHEKGAFSGASTAHQGLFEEAGNGTIFLDEIGEITPKLQIALLRVLETSEIRPVGSSGSKKISCRIITSTNAGLEELADDHRFRRDLIFRLRRLEIHVPSLRERIDDIMLLASHFLNIGRPQDVYATISTELAQKLISYEWPGNVRELKNAIERMRLMNSDKLYYNDEDLELRPASFTPVNAPHIPTTTPTTKDFLSKKEQTSFHKGRSRIRRLTTIRELFIEHQVLTRNEISRNLDISLNTATHDLQLLCSENFIEKLQPSASPRSAYFSLKQTHPE